VSKPVSLKEWLEITVRLMVDKPDEVKVVEGMSPDQSMMFFSIYVNYEHDMGKVVGRRGANVDALRKLSSAIAQGRYNRRCGLTIYDPTRQDGTSP